jgi:hypothetical protein
MREREALWMHAFYDDAYEEDQTERMAILDKVAKFLISIGCKVQYTACHDGSDINDQYGWFICGVAYKGIKYEHNPCYQVRYELPAELLDKLDAEFDAANVTEPCTDDERRVRRRFD